jgi:hypothetical protein
LLNDSKDTEEGAKERKAAASCRTPKGTCAIPKHVSYDAGNSGEGIRLKWQCAVGLAQ